MTLEQNKKQYWKVLKWSGEEGLISPISDVAKGTFLPDVCESKWYVKSGVSQIGKGSNKNVVVLSTGKANLRFFHSIYKPRPSCFAPSLAGCRAAVRFPLVVRPVAGGAASHVRSV